MYSNEQKHLLLIDDDQDDYWILEDVINTYFDTVTVSYFPDCGQINKNVFDNIDMVLLDINMPRMNGFQCLELIRNDYRLTKLPVIMYSNSFAPFDIQKAYEKGANLFMNKPLSIGKIKTAIDHILSIDWKNIEQLTSENTVSQTLLKF